jgi:Ni/Fe-hydrogenase 1 B-type cytochrome subunit
MSEAVQIPGVHDAHGARAVRRLSVYVYEAPVRIWHWVNAACLLVLFITGYLIASPLHSTSGEASNNFLMGYVRFAHFSAGQILAAAFLLRVYWAFVGAPHSRHIFSIPILSVTYWSEVWHVAKWYLFMAKQPKKYVGHNPLARLLMFLMFTIPLTFMIVTGFALYSEGEGIDSWQHKAFGWVFALFPNSQDVHTFHHLGMWVLIVFSILHIYAAVREDIVSRQSIISSMISGERNFKDDDAE